MSEQLLEKWNESFQTTPIHIWKSGNILFIQNINKKLPQPNQRVPRLFHPIARQVVILIILTSDYYQSTHKMLCL